VGDKFVDQLSHGIETYFVELGPQFSPFWLPSQVREAENLPISQKIFCRA
jgi:hypothetical protein